MSVGEKIKELREKSGIKIGDLAKMTSITVQTLYRYENGTINRISIDYADRISKALKCSPTELIGSNRDLPSATVPVYKKVLGKPLDKRVDNIMDFSMVPEYLTKDGDVYGIIIEDDCMQPFIFSGDVAIIKENKDDISDDNVIAVDSNERVLLYRVKLSMSGMSLSLLGDSQNSDFVSWTNIGDLCILGKCLEIHRTLG